MKKKIIWGAVSVVALVLAILFFRYRWYKLDYYIPKHPLQFSAPFRTMAQHDSLMQDKSWPYVLEITTDRSELLYYGSWHTTSPDDPQIAEIKQLWDEFDPTIAVTENRLGLFVGNLEAGVSYFAEFGALFALARRDDIPIYTLEPPWEVEVAEMKAGFPTEEVTLFYTLRVFLSERGQGKTREEIDDLARHLLKKRGSRPGLEGSLPNLAALDSVWNERFSGLGPWRDLPPNAIHPGAEPTRLNALANLANEIRDRHATAVILDLMDQGERIFALAGGSHVVKQEPVLRAGVGEETDVRVKWSER
ncbi:hypothetical protein GWN28_28785 [candidate division KSB1 bacterium]|nr:hypothetical protein [candidate division KSB1 bacterium]NIS27688.1 hypothetical protein [candidate division KSB1 bacterium]NIU91942.1 hypothetical protein [candidate division KSB1 bacterium]NIW22263.1 hypothetical protein [candidate division KSB1 bacterium]NIW72853.1 hypothetical protein [candidate division KSB1 bacterium]